MSPFVIAEQLMWYKLTIEGDSKPLARASHSCCAVGALLRQVQYLFP